MTVNFSLVTQPYTSITNSIKVALYKTSDPNAEYTAQTYASPHGERTWSFPGIDKANYLVKIFEVSGATIIQQLNYFTVAPGGSSNEFREPEFIIVGTTPNLVAGTNTATFDGSNGSPDFRGWDIVLRQRGIGGLRFDEQTFDSSTGVLQVAVEFSQEDTFEVEFIPKETNAGGVSDVAGPFGSIVVLKANTTLTPVEFLKKIIVKASSNIEVTLPSITTVIPNRIIYFESTTKGFTIVSANAGLIDWLEGGRTKIYLGVRESISIYREQERDENGVLTGLNFWRVHDAKGNFEHVGEEVSQYANVEMLLNKIELNGGGSDGLLVTENQRFYNDYVLKLPSSAVVDFGSWVTNKQKFSTALNGYFRVPDVRNLYSRATNDINNAGDYMEMDIQSHGHSIKTTASSYSTNTNADPVRGGMTGDANTRGQASTGEAKSIGLTGGTETRPKSYIIKKYLLA